MSITDELDETRETEKDKLRNCEIFFLSLKIPGLIPCVTSIYEKERERNEIYRIHVSNDKVRKFVLISPRTFGFIVFAVHPPAHFIARHARR